MKTKHEIQWSICDVKTTEGETMIVGGEGREFGLIATVTDEADAKQIIADREARTGAPQGMQPVAWRTRFRSEHAVESWHYTEGGERPHLNRPECYDLEPVYAAPPETTSLQKTQTSLASTAVVELSERIATANTIVLDDLRILSSDETAMIIAALSHSAASTVEPVAAKKVPTGIQAADIVADYLKMRTGGDLDAGDAANIIHILHEAGVRFAAPTTSPEPLPRDEARFARLADEPRAVIPEGTKLVLDTRTTREIMADRDREQEQFYGAPAPSVASPEPDAVREDRWSDALSAIKSITANPARAGQHLDIRIVGPGCSVTLLELEDFRELVARARLAGPLARNDRGSPLVEITRGQTTPCGECHLRPGETCDICDAKEPS